MDMKIRKLAMIFASIAILIGIILFLDPIKLLDTLSRADARLIILAFALSNVALFFRVMKWKSLLKGISAAELAPIQFFGITISNLTPGKIGEPVKSLALKMAKGIPVSSSLSTVIWERIMDVLIMMLFGVAGLYFIASADYFPLVIGAVFIFSCLIIFLLLMMYNEKFGRKAFNFMRRFPVMSKISDDFIGNFYSDSRISKAAFLKCFFWTFLAWLFDGLVFYAIYLSLSYEAVGISMPVILTCVLSLSVLVGLLSSLPGGAGGTEAVMIIVLGAIGISSNVAGSTVLLGRFFTFGYSLVVGYASFVHLGRKIDMKDIMKAVGI